MTPRVILGFVAALAGLCAPLGALVGVGPSPLSKQSLAEIEQSLHAEFTANPKSYDALAPYVRFLNRQDRSGDAILVLRSAPASLPGIDLLWAESHWYRGEMDTARNRLDSLQTGDTALRIAALELRIHIDYIEGSADSAETHCRQLLDQDPLNKTARLVLARLLIRRGRYDEADTLLQAAEAAYRSDVTVSECRAELLDAQGRTEDSQRLRRSAIADIVAHPPDSLDGLIAASSLLGQSGEPRAANDCIQMALRFAPADPFVAIEKIRLHRRVHDLVVAASTAVALLKRYPNCPVAMAELAESLWELRHDAEQTERLCQQVIAKDPTMLDSRCRLITLGLIAGDWDRAGKLLKENRAINASHIATENLAVALTILRSSELAAPQTTSDTIVNARSAAILGEILAARGIYERSAEWFAESLRSSPEDPRTLKAAGLAMLRCAEFNSATTLLENAFGRNHYDVTLKNVLDFLDDFNASKMLEDEAITVGYQDGDELTAEFTAYLARQFVGKVAARLGTTVEGPLRVQLCVSRDDISVLTEGIPPSCACGNAPQGSIYFNSTIFVWSPRAARRNDNTFRFDEALHRGIAEHVIQKGIGTSIPHWMREGVAHYTASLECPDWQAPLIEPLAGFLQSGGSFPLDELEATLVANRNPLCRPYAGFVVRHWVERYGLDGVLHLLTSMSGGKPWTSALEAQFGSPLDVLDVEARSYILDRFASIRLDLPVRMTPDALAFPSPQSATATIELARTYVARQRYDDAERALSQLLAQETPPTAALLVSGRAAFGQGDYVKAKEQIELGLELEKLRNQRVAVSKDYEILGLALAKLGDSTGACDAFRAAIALNPLDSTENGPYGQLLSLLGKQKNDEYYAILEQRLSAHRADPRPRMELAQWYESQGNPEKALQYYLSAAGVRPDWTEVHRRLAPLAMGLDLLDLAHASYRVLHLDQPADVRILEHLAECERRLADQTTPDR